MCVGVATPGTAAIKETLGGAWITGSPAEYHGKTWVSGGLAVFHPPGGRDRVGAWYWPEVRPDSSKIFRRPGTDPAPSTARNRTMTCAAGPESCGTAKIFTPKWGSGASIEVDQPARGTPPPPPPEEMPLPADTSADVRRGLFAPRPAAANGASPYVLVRRGGSRSGIRCVEVITELVLNPANLRALHSAVVLLLDRRGGFPSIGFTY